MSIMAAAVRAAGEMGTPFALAARAAAEREAARRARRIANGTEAPPPPDPQAVRLAALRRLSKLFDRLADPAEEKPRVYAAAIAALAGDDTEVATLAGELAMTSPKTPVPFITAPMILRAMGGAGRLR